MAWHRRERETWVQIQEERECKEKREQEQKAPGLLVLGKENEQTGKKEKQLVGLDAQLLNRRSSDKEEATTFHRFCSLKRFKYRWE